MHEEAIELDVVVVGAGVVGLAVARALAQHGRDVRVLEAEPRAGMHTSSRNSEVIHAGLYYPEGSLKARLCIAGRQALYRYCEARGIAHRRIGKLLVATDDGERATLEAIAARAARHGVDDLVPLDGRAARRLEPAVRCVAALLSPSTGIIDSHALIAALLADLCALGGSVLLSAPVLSGEVESHGFTLRVREPRAAAPTRVRCRALVNAAGLRAQALAGALRGVPPDVVPPSHFAKGHYYALRGPSPFARLVYPVPPAHGLGIHVTLDLAGRARFGPDVAWIDEVDYAFDETRLPAFAEAIRRYYPALSAAALEPAYTGIRPKLAPAGSAARDFSIEGPAAHGIPGLVQLFGIESPGLTAALAIAEEVATHLT